MAGAVLAEAVAAEAVQLAQAILLTALPGRHDHLLCLVKLACSLVLSRGLRHADQLWQHARWLHQQLQPQLPAAAPTPVSLPARLLPKLAVRCQYELFHAPRLRPSEPAWIAART